MFLPFTLVMRNQLPKPLCSVDDQYIDFDDIGDGIYTRHRLIIDLLALVILFLACLCKRTSVLLQCIKLSVIACIILVNIRITVT